MTEDEEDAALEARYCSCEEFALGTSTCPETNVHLCATCGKWQPEYIKCVATDASGRAAYCGRVVLNEFSFCDWAHADGNEACGGRLLTCGHCKAARSK